MGIGVEAGNDTVDRTIYIPWTIPMAVMELTQVYLEREQKRGLQAKARANGTGVAEEVRRAVDACLAGVPPEELTLLDEGSRARREVSEGNVRRARTDQRTPRRGVRAAFAFEEEEKGEARMSLIADILDRLSAIQVVKERLRETGSRVEQWVTQVVILDRQVQDIDRRLVRIETLADAAGAGTRKGAGRSPGAQ
jgi:hypothetical protein